MVTTVTSSFGVTAVLKMKVKRRGLALWLIILYWWAERELNSLGLKEVSVLQTEVPTLTRYPPIYNYIVTKYL